MRPQLLAGLLYLGAGLGLSLCKAVRRRSAEAPLRRGDVLPLLGVLISGGVMGPLLMLLGLTRLGALTGSLLLNREAPFTILLAVMLFGEHIGRYAAAASVLILSGADVHEGGDHRVGLAAHQVSDDLTEQAAVIFLAAHARSIDVRVAHLVTREQLLLEQPLERGLDRVQRDAAALAERGVDGLRFAVAPRPEWFITAVSISPRSGGRTDPSFMVATVGSQNRRAIGFCPTLDAPLQSRRAQSCRTESARSARSYRRLTSSHCTFAVNASM